MNSFAIHEKEVFNIQYFDYRSAKKFYTISEACKVLGVNKLQLGQKSEQYHIPPRLNETNTWGFSGHELCMLHNFLYHEDCPGKSNTGDPWR